MKRQTLFRHLRAVVVFYKKRRTIDQIAERFGYKPLYVRKVLRSKAMKPYIFQLTNGFIEKARGYFDTMITEMQSGQYTASETPETAVKAEGETTENSRPSG